MNWTKLLFFICFLMLCSCESSGPKQGAIAPDFALTSIQGAEESLAKHRGKLVLVHFWADWCESCRKEFPLMQAYYKEFGGPKFELLAINVGQASAVSEAFMEEFGATFPMLADEQGRLAAEYGIEKYPTNYLVNPDGKIVRKVVGWIDRDFIANVLYNIEQQNR